MEVADNFCLYEDITKCRNNFRSNFVGAATRLFVNHVMLERKLTTMSQETPTSTSEEADVILLKEVNDDADLPNLFMEYSEMGNVVNTFPWITDFTKLCQLEFSGINLKRLLKLMNIFHEKVSPSVNECFTRPNRATKLKKIMSNTLMFFHMTYSDFRIMSPSDLSTYLHKMSDLMAMYLDMEIKASRTGTECLPKIASKICSSLIIYFGKSYEYIFDTILKSKLITDNARVLCDLIFRRVLRDFPGPCIDVISYLRCLFVFKIWKAITKDSEEKLKIIKLACTKLQPPPGLASKLSVSKALRSFLPKVPRKCLDVTEFLMRAKFCSRNQIKLFLKAAEDPNVFHEFQPSMDHSAQSDNADRSGFVGLMDDLWSDFSTKFRGSISTSVENEKIIKHEHNTAKNEVKKVKKLKKIIEVDRNGSVKDNKSHAAPVKNDVDDLLVTSSLVRGPKSNIDEIYIDAIDSCVKSEGESDPSVSCMKELLDNNTIPSNINLYGGTYDEPVASTSCVKVELNAALIEDPFIDNLSDTGITIGKLSDIAIGPKEDIFMRDCEDANTPLITSNSLFSKTHKNFPSIQNCEKIGKYNYSALNFRSKSLLLIQDDEISESDLHSFENSEAERQFQNEDNLVPKQIATVRNQDGTRKFKTPGELKLVLPPKCFYEQDIIKLALTARSNKRKTSEPDPASKGKEKKSKRKSPRTRAESLAKSMSSALDDLETDNWIESSS